MHLVGDYGDTADGAFDHDKHIFAIEDYVEDNNQEQFKEPLLVHLPEGYYDQTAMKWLC